MTSTPSRLVSAASQELARAGVPSPRYDAEELLCWVVEVSRAQLVALAELTHEQEAAYRAAVARRASREPLQHITGTAAFRHLELQVGPGVFVPRPETELMAGVAIDELRSVSATTATPRAVDLCSGSGAVALALATEAPGTQVTAVELSPDAHSYAVRNTAGHDVDVRLGDMAVATDDLAGRAHVVTANPPYVPLDAYESVAPEVRDFDPSLALWSGDDGLDAIKVVARTAARLLVDGGLVVCEHANAQAESAVAVFSDTGDFAHVRDHRDLAGRARFVTARRVPRRSAAAGTMDA